jgi:hypothetical protein
MHSLKDCDGRLWVACSECERGANGRDKGKCAANMYKRFDGCGCFLGSLMKRYAGKPMKQLPRISEEEA